MSADLHDLLDRGVSPRPTTVDGDALVARGRRRRTTKRASAGVLAGAVLVTGGLAVTGLFDGPRAPIVSEVPDGQAPEWQHVEGAPLEGRARPTLAADGDRVVAWGGESDMRSIARPGGSELLTDVLLQDGAVLDLTTGAWQTVEAPPIDARSFAAVRLSGDTLAVWGGRGRQAVTGGGLLDGTDPPLVDGAVYDLTTTTWTRVPPMPLALRTGPVVDWDGEQLLVWGGDDAETGTPASDGAVWTAASGWTVLADFPLVPRSGSAIGVDADRLVVWGGGTNLEPETGAEELVADGAVYDRATNTWSVLPPVDLAPGWFSYGDHAPTALLDGDRFLVAGGASTAPLAFNTSGAWLDLTTGVWAPITEPPAGTRYVVSSADGATAFADDDGDEDSWQLWAYDLGRDRWLAATYPQTSSVATPWADALSDSASIPVEADGTWRPVTTMREDGVTFRPTLRDVGAGRDFVSLVQTDSGVLLFGGIVRDPDGGRLFGHDGEHRADGWFLPNP